MMTEHMGGAQRACIGHSIETSICKISKEYFGPINDWSIALSETNLEFVFGLL
jgi:hypothetical protein